VRLRLHYCRLVSRLALLRRRSQSPASPIATSKADEAAHRANEAGWSRALPTSQRTRAISIYQEVSETARRQRRSLLVTGRPPCHRAGGP
jgi:hypothetical protein